MVPTFRFLLVVLCVCFALAAPGQDAAPSSVGLPVDWSFRHLVHSQPWTAATEAAAGRDPRVLYNWLLRERGRKSAVPGNGARPKFTNRVDWNFTLGTGKVAANMYPAKFSFDPSSTATLSCTTDYVVFALDTAGSASQPNLVQFNNIYSAPTGTNFCPGTGPNVMSAYNVTTATFGAILTSPALSLDGTQVAFIESAAGTGSIFHVLTFGTTGTNGCFAGQAGCTAGSNSYSAVAPGAAGGNNAVMTSLSYSASTTTTSSPWVDYHNNVVYFGDDSGKIYKTTCAFHCASPPAIAANWPVTVASGVKLGPVVVDPVSNVLLVGGSTGNLYAVNLSACPPTCTIASLAVGSALPFGGVIDAPLVDTTFETVFAFAGDDGTGSGVIVQTNPSLGPVASNVSKSMGSAGFNVVSGTFDAAYFTNTVGSAAVTSYLYACGGQAGSSQPALYQVPMSATGTLSTSNPPKMASISHQNIPGNPGVGCSPLVEFLSGGTDRLFFSESSLPLKKCTNTSAAGSGCLSMYTLTSAGASGSPAATVVENTGSSGIIVDNASASTQASSIYFSNEGTGTCTIGAATPAYCAIKLTQSALQ